MTMRFRLLSAVLWTIVILILCWTPEIYLPVEEGPGSWLDFLPLDKVVHLGIFAIFGVLWLRALPTCSFRFLWVGLAGTALAIITEMVQNVPIINREGEVQDVVADVVGVLIGILVFPWIERTLGAHRSISPGVLVDSPPVPSSPRLTCGEDDSR
jgi:hypothetical protein